MNHSFDVDIAIKFGVPEAIVIENFRFWIAKNKANNRHCYEGKYWTYNSAKALTELFPYWSQDQIKRIIKRLEDAAILVSGNFNQNPYDRTKWYALSDLIDRANSHNGKDEIAQSTIQTDINTDVNHLLGEQAQAPAPAPAAAQVPSLPNAATAQPPAPALATKEPKPKAARNTKLPDDFEPNETAARLAQELRVNLAVELGNFADYHHAKGSVMADWQAALRTWIRNAAKFQQRDAAKVHGPLETTYQRTMREKVERFAPSIAKRAPQAPAQPYQSAADFFRTVEVPVTVKADTGALK